jgi:predicted MFS family arabinose efflux permease
MLARVLQAASGATFPLALRTLRETLSPKRFGQAMGIITATYGGVAGVDSILGGWLTDAYGFRSVFAAIAVFGIVATFVVARTIPPFRGTATGRMDWWGAAILCLAFTVIQAGIGSAANAPIAVAAAMVGVGLLLLGGFWLVERRRSHPLVPARYLGSRQVWPMLVTSVFTLAAFLSVVNYTIPVFTQDDQVGYALSATMSALLFIVPVCTVNLVFAPLAGRFAPRFGWRRLMRLGLAGMVPVLVIMALAVESRWLVFAAVPLLGMFACGAALTAINGLSVILSPKESPGVLPGVNSTCFGIGASLGIALAAQLSAQHGGAMSSFRDALWMSAIAAALAFLASLAVGGVDADSTERV